MIRNNILIATIIFCCCSCFTKTQDVSTRFSEQELYNFGLEPNQSVYDFFKSGLSASDLKAICEETKDFRVIKIAFMLKDSTVTECEVSVYDYFPEKKEGRIARKEISITGEKFKNLLLNKKANFYFIDNYELGHYDFRLNLNKYCN